MPDSVLPRIAAGEPGAVSECLDRYGGLVWSIARRFLANSADAEDAVQEIFVDLWKNAHRYDGRIAAETTFIHTIARRRLIDRRRHGQRRPDPVPLPETLPAPAVDAVELRDEAARAAAALDELREEPRRVLCMAIYQGLTHEEIARATGLPLGTVKTHVRRGLLQVRERLKPLSGLAVRGTPILARTLAASGEGLVP